MFPGEILLKIILSDNGRLSPVSYYVGKAFFFCHGYHNITKSSSAAKIVDLQKWCNAKFKILVIFTTLPQQRRDRRLIIQCFLAAAAIRDKVLEVKNRDTLKHAN